MFVYILIQYTISDYKEIRRKVIKQFNSAVVNSNIYPNLMYFNKLINNIDLYLYIKNI